MPLVPGALMHFGGAMSWLYRGLSRTSGPASSSYKPLRSVTLDLLGCIFDHSLVGVLLVELPDAVYGHSALPCLDTYLSISARTVMAATIKNCAVLLAPPAHTALHYLQLAAFKTLSSHYQNDSHSCLHSLSVFLLSPNETLRCVLINLIDSPALTRFLNRLILHKKLRLYLNPVKCVKMVRSCIILVI